MPRHSVEIPHQAVIAPAITEGYLGRLITANCGDLDVQPSVPLEHFGEPSEEDMFILDPWLNKGASLTEIGGMFNPRRSLFWVSNRLSLIRDDMGAGNDAHLIRILYGKGYRDLIPAKPGTQPSLTDKETIMMGLYTHGLSLLQVIEALAPYGGATRSSAESVKQRMIAKFAPLREGTEPLATMAMIDLLFGHEIFVSQPPEPIMSEQLLIQGMQHLLRRPELVVP